MIVISSAMGKSGSTYFCNLLEDMLELVSVRTGQLQLRKAFDGRFIKRIDFSVWIRLIWINVVYGSIVIKTHTSPTFLVRLLIQLGLARATYNYRDIRDVILSALDHGERNRKAGNVSGVYADLHTVEEAIDKVGTASIYEMNHWKKFGRAYFVRYSNLMQNRLSELQKVSRFLGWDIPEGDLVSLVEKHERLKPQAANFNKGTINRYKMEMSEDQIARCNHSFHDFLIEMGYEV